ncbi:MAG: hybrid sensor histidine kinase/response regulator [Syntrophaceae bacterium]|nr:hybrid sensor histidine kinase/response regulator [Syntrophaceae bacterium]
MMDKRGAALVLVIDDEESIRDGCSQVLKKSGYSVVTTEDGMAGIRIARERKPAVVFVDLKMPSISGMEVIDILSRDIPDVVLIVITGYASIVSAVKAMKKGVYDYIPKPFTPDQLRAVTKRGFEHRSLMIETRRLREEKEQVQQNFITFVSHEMRSPLATIQQYIEALKVIAGESLKPEGNEIVERCNKRLQNLQDMVEHWLDISRIEAGTFARNREPVDLSSVILKSVEELSGLCDKRKLSVTTDIADGLPEIMGDEESLVRVLINIIGNATKYTAASGVISIKAEYDEHYVIISVSDTGIGIPQDKIPIIFEPFYRVKQKGDRQKGSGLGLTFCKKIVEAHEGTIDVASVEGEGTTFTVRFPR